MSAWPRPAATPGFHRSCTVDTSQNDITGTDVLTVVVLNECRKRLRELIARLQSVDVAGGVTPSGDMSFTQTGHQERDVRQTIDPSHARLGVFSPSPIDERVTASRTHVIEDISVGDYGMQILKLPVGDLWTAKRINVGERAVQLIGTFSDMSMQNCLERL
ncbi:uncharacterized protein J7T54_002741 [Emericellopsis cladophorae]|uniref:Uncharacterized protein n=1 Tax=Emericellopsis cladophorae TaxID=2686198 RepID=A0A9P9XU72_9HYPO|nr:uncharacterized protein J7T54_002741 [Emericellopsis cladophorae]KAI6777820.1 hypothetical protein J7T54_002741 [Emericellopsis cladophorae]